MSAAAGVPGPALLDVARLCAWYDAAQILFDVDLQIGRGEVVAIMGRNGAGKSTTLKSIIGLVPKRRGRLTFAGREISSAPPQAIARAGIAYVPQDRRIFADLTVLENLEVGRQPPRRAPNGAELPPWTPARLFDLFPNLGEMPDRRGSEMSGGEQQMLAVARSLMGNPSLLLLDEPAEGVAPVIARTMAQMVRDLAASGVSILLSEQNMDFAQSVSDRVYIIEQGAIRHQASMAQIAAEPQAARAYLGL
jgi:branched-chain amino acid transport system ATP-binding protein